MAKNSVEYVCSNCGNISSRKLGKCRACGEFNTLVEQTVDDPSGKQAGLKTTGAIAPKKKSLTLSEIKKKPISRIPTKIHELDRVLGGGFVDAEVILLGGHPGSGKSTLSLDIANRFAMAGKRVLYSSGEESEQQIGLRADRMGITDDGIQIVNETLLESLLGHIEAQTPDVLILDSLQTIASNDIPGSVGSVSQGKEAAHTLTRIAKNDGIIMIFINQIIKSGEFAGSEAVQHIVDCSLILESDKETPLKFLRATKNRFGDTTEVGVFQHSETGLDEVSDPSGILINDDEILPGTACSFLQEGVRQIPAEIQALVGNSTLPSPRKQFSGVDYNRAQIVCAILDKFCTTKLFEKDVFISTVSGLKIKDPQVDLAMAAAVLSSCYESNLEEKVSFVGELNLTGLVRGGIMTENKIREAQRLGFDRIFVPKNIYKTLDLKKFSIKVDSISNIKELKTILKK